MSFYLARSLCTCVFILHSSPFLLRKGQTYCKSTNIFWISYQILAFSAYNQKIWCFFRKTSSFFLALKKNQQFFLELRKITNSYLNLKFFSKTHQSSLNLKGGSTSHLGLLPLRGKEETALLGAFFRKPTRPSLPLRKAPHLSPSLSLLRRERMCQPPFQ